MGGLPGSLSRSLSSDDPAASSLRAGIRTDRAPAAPGPGGALLVARVTPRRARPAGPAVAAGLVRVGPADDRALPRRDGRDRGRAALRPHDRAPPGRRPGRDPARAGAHRATSAANPRDQALRSAARA